MNHYSPRIRSKDSTRSPLTHSYFPSCLPFSQSILLISLPVVQLAVRRLSTYSSQITLIDRKLKIPCRIWQQIIRPMYTDILPILESVQYRLLSPALVCKLLVIAYMSSARECGCVVSTIATIGSVVQSFSFVHTYCNSKL